VAAGWGKNFIHTTGHGLGLEIHEPPSLSSQNLQVLGKNMVITLEPGLYFPGEFGYRYENTVWLSDEGPVELGET
jgi:Xaa-Pro aminopeptidase